MGKTPQSLEGNPPSNKIMNKSFQYLTLAACITVVTSLIPTASAQIIYTDATGDEFSGNTILDIATVEVSNDATDLIFKLNLLGDPVATDWGKYMIGIDVDGGGATGDTAGNGWGRPISMSMGMDYWYGSWVDSGGGAEVYNYSGSWNRQNATYDTPGGLTISKDTNSVTITYPFASLGLSISDTFYFDVYTSGGGGTDTAIDAAANPAQTVSGWGDPYDSAANLEMYTLVTPTDPTNMVTVLVNMEVPIDIGDFFIGDMLYIRGSFNGWLAPDPTSNPDAANWEMTQDVNNTYGLGTNVFFGTFPIAGFNGRQHSYKYWSLFTQTEDITGYEFPMLSCGADRVLTITNEGGAQTEALVYFSDRSLADPTTPITFNLDMSVMAALATFSMGDVVYARGNFNDWDTSFALTNNPDGANPYFYSGVREFTAPCGACFSYKYNINGDVWEDDPNRELIVNCTNGSLPVVYFNNQSTDCPFVTVETNWVTFTVDLSNAVEVSGNSPYDGTWDVFINGDFINWADGNWNTNGLADYQLMQVGSTSNYSITLPFAPGDALRVEYKYGANTGDPNALDKEAGFAQNHVSWIRTTPGLTNYSISDVWTGTNAQNIANLQEDQLSLAISDGIPGTVQIDWMGVHCAELQSATNAAGPYSTISDAAGVGSMTRPASQNQEYFRIQLPGN